MIQKVCCAEKSYLREGGESLSKCAIYVPVFSFSITSTRKDDKKVPSCSEVLSNVSDVKLYESSISDSCNNEQSKLKTKNICDQASMSPVEGPVNEMPKTMFDNKSPDKHSSDTPGDPGGCEQFSGQIVYNPDGSAYIMEENDDSLLEQIPKQEGSIVERGGKCLSEVEYPKIDQAVYIERRKVELRAIRPNIIRLRADYRHFSFHFVTIGKE